MLVGCYNVRWEHVELSGETLEIRIELENRAEPIVVSGVIEKWGRFYHPADL